jgi:hypothetical protein
MIIFVNTILERSPVPAEKILDILAYLCKSYSKFIDLH